VTATLAEPRASQHECVEVRRLLEDVQHRVRSDSDEAVPRLAVMSLGPTSETRRDGREGQGRPGVTAGPVLASCEPYV
jgi:hypothetical protein